MELEDLVPRTYRQISGTNRWVPDLPEGEVNQNEMKGIYKIEQNQMTYCWAAPGNPRPSDFSTPLGSNQTLIRLERFSPDEQEIEHALRAAGVQFHQDEDIGWIDSVGDKNSNISADAIAKLVLPLKKLDTLNFESSELTDKGLQSVAKLTSLKSLHVKSASITTEGFAQLRSLNHLTSLSIESKQFNDASIEHILDMKQLSGLHFNGTAVTDTGLKKLLQMESLRRIGLSNTEISDDGFATLTQLPKLHYVSLVGAKYNNKALAEFARRVPNLTHLNVSPDILDSAALLASLRKNPDLMIFLNHNLLPR